VETLETANPFKNRTPLKSDVRTLLLWMALIGTANLAIDLPGRMPLAWDDVTLTLVAAVSMGIVFGLFIARILKHSREESIVSIPRRVKPIALILLICAWLLSAYIAYSVCLSTSLSHRTFVTSRSCWETQELVQICFFVQMFTTLLWIYGWTLHAEKEHGGTADGAFHA